MQYPDNLFLDNLLIYHNKGHLLEEDQYYPFGLKMAGISDQALPVIPNNYLYNGKELNNDEFSDGSGLDWYSYGMRENKLDKCDNVGCTSHLLEIKEI
ncbi:MAG: hypothetical protein ACRDE2_13200 [Chitinophagaceae bacterium]